MTSRDEENRAGVQHILSQAAELQRQAACEDLDAAQLKNSPFVIYKPVLMRDGNAWEALFGDNPMVGVAGYGDSPAEAVASLIRRGFTKKEQRTMTEKCFSCGEYRHCVGTENGCWYCHECWEELFT